MIPGFAAGVALASFWAMCPAAVAQQRPIVPAPSRPTAPPPRPVAPPPRPTAPPPRPTAPAPRPTPPPPPAPRVENAGWISGYRAPRPIPPAAFPDDPPPHEGATIDIPYVVESPDVIRVEVLEALPGRPLSGERLVHPNGKINLEFYGDIHVAGLTTDQIKAKVILRLRDFLPDATLGLVEAYPDDLDQQSSPRSEPVPPPRKSLPARSRQGPETHPSPFSSRVRVGTQGIGPLLRPIAFQTSPFALEFEGPHPGEAGDDSQNPFEEVPLDTDLEYYREYTEAPIRVLRAIPPEESDRVFVEVVTYNSKYYSVWGDVNNPARFPIKGNETVLDALQATGDLGPTADARNIRLVRPARGGRPSKVYPIDYDAIVARGEPTANLQLLPGDRLVIGRDKVVEINFKMHRLVEPVQMIETAIHYHGSMMKTLKEAGLTDQQRQAVVRNLSDFYRNNALAPDGPNFDAKAQRDALLPEMTAPR